MTHCPLISVIMPVYNSEKYLRYAIESILTQSYKNWELIIGDDASTDDTAVIIDTFKDDRIRVFRHEHNLGAFINRNYLLKKARGAFITFQDADDFSDENRLLLQANELQSKPSLGMVGCQVGFTDLNGNLIRVSDRPITYSETLDSMYSENVIGSAVMMIRADVLASVGGGYREYFQRLSYQDYDLAFLIAQHFECYCLPQALYYYRQHSESLSKTISIDRLLAKNVVIYLARQRKEKRADDLMEGNPDKVDAYFALLRKPYEDDASLVYREFASDFMYNGLYSKALYVAWLAVRVRPGKLQNWRTLQYCLRKTLIAKIKMLAKADV